MKRSIAILLLLAMILGVFAGCGNQQTDPTQGSAAAPTETESNVPADALENLAAAAEYLKTYYKDALTVTAKDYTRLGAVRVGLDSYPITWTANVSEDIVKIVTNDDGSATIDVNEAVTEDTPYVLTATVADAYGNTQEVSFEYTIPASLGDMTAIVDLAYALEQGAAMDSEVTLTGVISSVNTPYDAGYKNVTVTIKVAGREDKPIMCYRLKGEGADIITVGDTITVTGIIKNYNGTIEFDAGCTLDSYEKGNVTFEVPEDPCELIDMIYALGKGDSLPVSVTLTGTVTTFEETYTEQYKNISVWMAVEGREDKPILAYRLKGDEVAEVAVGDTITVTGTPVHYVSSSGTAKFEFASGCQLVERISGGGAPPAAEKPIFWVPEVKEGEEYYLYMPINGVNFYFTGKTDGNYLATSTNSGDAEPVYAEQVSTWGWRFYVLDGQTKNYIEIYEYIKTNGKPGGRVRMTTEPSMQFFYGCDCGTYYFYSESSKDHYYMGTYGSYTTIGVSSTYYITGSKVHDVGKTQFVASFMKSSDAPAPEAPPAVEDNYVTKPAVGTPYKLGLNQTQKGAIYYFTGAMSQYYGATETDVTKAIDVVLEQAQDGYYLTFTVNGVKQYVYIEQSGTHTNFKFGEKKAVFTWDSEKATLVTTVDGTPAYMGTYGSYVTVGGMLEDKVDEDTYLVHLYPSDGTVTPDPDPTPDPEPETGITMVTNPVTGTAYKLYVEQGNVGKTLYFTGTTANANYYMATTENVSEAVDVYLEAVDGGYRIYFDVNGTKTYLDAYMSGTHLNARLTTSPTAVFTYNTEYNTMVTTVDGTDAYFGSYNTYTTLSASKFSYISTSFPSHFGTVGNSTEPEQPEDPEVPTVNRADFETIVTSNANGDSKYVNTYTTTNGWTVTNSAIQTGGPEGCSNPQFHVIGPDNTHKAPCLNGKTSAPGKVTSPTLTRGISKLTMSYTHMFSDKNLSVTITVTDKATGATYTKVVEQTVAGTADKFTVENVEWVLETPVTGDFTIEVVNNCPSALDSNKDRFTILSLGWESATGSAPVEPTPDPDEEAAKAVDALIEKIGTVTKDSEAAIKAARNAYDALNDAAKAKVTKLDVLTAAEKAYEDLTSQPEVDPNAPVAGVAYKLYVEQGNLSKTLYFAGTTANKEYYLSTTENVNEAVDVYVEEVDGGYRMYFDANGTKTYIDAYMSGTYLNARLTTSPTAVFTYNAQYNTLVTEVDGTQAYIGTYSTYNTLSASKFSFISTSFPSHLAVVEGGTTPDPTPDPEPEVPVVPAGAAVYNMADYVVDGELGGGEFTRDLDENVKFTISSGWFTTQARIYKNANGVIESTKPMTSITLNAGNKDAAIGVYVSEDGAEYTFHTTINLTVAYADHTIDLGEGYKYVKFDCSAAQMRIKTMTVTFAE